MILNIKKNIKLWYFLFKDNHIAKIYYFYLKDEQVSRGFISFDLHTFFPQVSLPTVYLCLVDTSPLIFVVLCRGCLDEGGGGGHIASGEIALQFVIIISR